VTSNEVILCTNLRKVYSNEAESLEILKDVNFALQQGETASITGPSGCGKSTLLSILGGLDKASSGCVKVGGVDLVNASEMQLSSFRASQTGFIFQFHYLLKDFTALENAMMPAFMQLGDRKKAEERARPLLEAVGLMDRLHHLPSRLSGGERQRVAIARALVNQPSIIFADEPTGNLDRTNASLVENLLFKLVEESSMTMLMVTHDPLLAERARSRYRLVDGAIHSL